MEFSYTCHVTSLLVLDSGQLTRSKEGVKESLTPFQHKYQILPADRTATWHQILCVHIEPVSEGEKKKQSTAYCRKVLPPCRCKSSKSHFTTAAYNPRSLNKTLRQVSPRQPLTCKVNISYQKQTAVT